MTASAAIDSCVFVNFHHIRQHNLFGILGYQLFATIYVILEMRGFRSPEIRDDFEKRLQRDIKHVPLSVDDLVEMAHVPESPRCSNAELSCFVMARRLGSVTLSDDQKAVKYIRRYATIGVVRGTVDLLLEAYYANLVGDDDLRAFQKTLEDNRFCMPFDLCTEGAKRRYYFGAKG